jgi:hypothetical protein
MRHELGYTCLADFKIIPVLRGPFFEGTWEET